MLSLFHFVARVHLSYQVWNGKCQDFLLQWKVSVNLLTRELKKKELENCWKRIDNWRIEWNPQEFSSSLALFLHSINFVQSLESTKNKKRNFRDRGKKREIELKGERKMFVSLPLPLLVMPFTCLPCSLTYNTVRHSCRSPDLIFPSRPTDVKFSWLLPLATK